MKKTAYVAFALTLGLSAAFATAADQHAGHHAAASASKAAAKSEGEIKKVDKKTGKITIKHGPLANLDMPPMTMAFAVKEPAVLDSLKAGDKIKFVAQKEGRGFQAADVEVVK